MNVYILSTLCHMAPCGHSADPQPPLFVHIVIECPNISYNTVLPIITSFRLHSLKFCFKFYYRYVLMWTLFKEQLCKKSGKNIFLYTGFHYKSYFSAHFGCVRYDFLTTLKNIQLRVQNELINLVKSEPLTFLILKILVKLCLARNLLTYIY